MPKPNVLSRGMKVFFSLLLAFFTSGCTIFPFVPLKRLSLGSWFCRTLLFFRIARIISTLNIYKIFKYLENKLILSIFFKICGGLCMGRKDLEKLLVGYFVFEKIKNALHIGLGLAIAVLMWAIVLFVLSVLGIGHM